VNPANPGAVAQMDGTQQAVRALGFQSQVVNAATLEEYERAFARLSSEGVNGVLLLADPANVAYASKIAELAQLYRLPTAFQIKEPVAAGGLMSYGADNNADFRLAAFYVDRVFRGESLPICPYSSRPGLISRSISRPPRHLASQSPRCCSRSPMR
jgi:putative ABC transport system substrate-binding protein